MRIPPHPPLPDVAKRITEKARLIASVAATPPLAAVRETPEARLERLAKDPLALYAALQTKLPESEGMSLPKGDVRSRLVNALLQPAQRAYAEAVKEAQAAPRKARTRVLQELKSTAPALTPQPPPPESATRFTPTAEDMETAISSTASPPQPPFSAFRDFVLGLGLPPAAAGQGAVLALILVFAMALTLWLLV